MQKKKRERYKKQSLELKKSTSKDFSSMLLLVSGQCMEISLMENSEERIQKRRESAETR